MDKLLECLRGTRGTEDTINRNKSSRISESIKHKRLSEDVINVDLENDTFNGNLDEIDLDDEVAVIDTDLKGNETKSPNEYLGKKVVVCPICLKPLFSDRDNCDVYCPVCDKDVEVGDAVGVVTEPTEGEVEDTEVEVTDEVDETEGDDEFEDEFEGEDEIEEGCGKIDKKSIKTEASIFQHSGNPEPAYKVGDIVRPDYDPSAGFTGDSRMDMKFKITEIGPYDKSNGYKYVAEPITDAARENIKDEVDQGEWEDEGHVEFYGFEGVDTGDGEASRFELAESVKTESDKPAAQSIEDCQKWVDYDMKTYGHVSEETQDIIKKAGFQIIKDDHGDYEVAAKSYESMDGKSIKPESFDEEGEPARYTVSLITDEGEIGFAATDSEKEAKDKARKLLDLADSNSAVQGVRIFDIATGDEITLDDTATESVKTESEGVPGKKFSELTDEELTSENIGLSMIPVDDDVPVAWDADVTTEGDSVIFTGYMAPGVPDDGVVTIKVPKDKVDKYYRFHVEIYNESCSKTESYSTVAGLIDDRCTIDDASKVSESDRALKIKQVDEIKDADVDLDISDSVKILTKDGKRYIKDSTDYYEIVESVDDSVKTESVEVKVCPEGSVTVTSSEADTTVEVAPAVNEESEEVEDEVEINDFDTDTFDSEVTKVANDSYEDDELVYETRKVRQNGKDTIVVEGLISNKSGNRRRVRFTCEGLTKSKKFKVEGFKDYEGYLLVNGKVDGNSYKVESVESKLQHNA